MIQIQSQMQTSARPEDRDSVTVMEQQVYTTKQGALSGAAATHIDGVAWPTGYPFAKRTVDVIGSLLGLALLFPIFVLVAVLVRIASPGPIFHRRRVLSQQNFRDGGPLHTYDAFKFRTMVVNADEVLARNPQLWAEFQKDFKLHDDPRVTRIGHLLRRTSLDELPQLLNVLRGQMSLVGPRMIVEKELEKYGDARNKTRLLVVKPGLTGYWQVCGRQNVSYAERVRLDMWYVANRSLSLDLQILWRTVGEVLRRRGAV